MQTTLDSYGLDRYSTHVDLTVPKDLVGRVLSEDKGRYKIITVDGPKTGTVLGKFRHAAADKNDFPKVGDWVTIRTIPGDSDNIVIETILPRLTQLARQEIWPKQHIQILATNIDYACIVITPPTQPKLGQIERFISLIMQGKAQPIIILNKTDLSEDTDGENKKLADYFPNILVCSTSAETGYGLDNLRRLLTKGSTITFVGESGVGKSSLINHLLGSETQTTGAVRLKDSAGKHTTTRRDMFVSPDGFILIDSPGIRELGFTDDGSIHGFEDIAILARECKFTNCDHDKSDGCAVKEAVAKNQLDEKRYRHYLKIKN